MNAFKLAMEVNNVFQGFLLLGVIGLEQGFHLHMNLLGRAGFVAAHFIWQAFVGTHIEPVLKAV